MSTALFDTAINSESPHGDERNLRVKFAPLFEKIKAGAVEREKSRTLPIAQVQELVAAGFGAVRVGKEFGGAGANLTEFFELLIDLAAADSNVAHLFRGHFVFLDDISLTGTSEANRRWSYRAVSGAVIANASSEQGGQGWWDTGTKIEKRAEGHILNGVKYYSTGSNFSDWILVSAKSPGDEKIGIPVATNASGVEVEDDWDGFGQRLTGSGTTRFKDVEIHLDDAISYFSREPNYLISYFQLFLLAVQAGIARSALEDTLDFVRPRTRVFGSEERPIPKDDPHVQRIIGQIAGQVHAIESSVLRAASHLEGLFDAIKSESDSDADYYRVENSVFAAQSIVSDLVLTTTSRFFEVGGASATSIGRVLDRHWRNARTVASHNPVYLRQKILGERLLKPDEAITGR